MKTEFGEVVVLQRGQEYIPGIMLRESENRVVLEEVFDLGWKRNMVLHVFEEGCSLRNKGDLSNCLKVARKYEEDLNIPIYVINECEVTQDERKACYVCIVEWSNRRPWEVIPPSKKCVQCRARQSNTKTVS